MVNIIGYCGLLFLEIIAVQGAASSNTLASYNVDPTSVSDSGLSAGGFMAAQLGIAYSDVFVTGFGVFAGGPFDCARNQAVSWTLSHQANAHNNYCSTTPACPMATRQSPSLWPT